ncbi:hypothetical protein EJD97_016922, partial [Solanum chilense]
MAGNPSDDRFRPPDPSLAVENAQAQSRLNEATEGSSSISSHLREEAIQMEMVEAEMDEFRRTTENNRKRSGMVGEAQPMDVQKGLGSDELQVVHSAKSQSYAAEKSQSREAATSSSTLVRSEGIQQELVTGELSQGNNPKNQQSVEQIVDRHTENRREGETGESHAGHQKQGNRVDNSQDNISNFNRVQDYDLQGQTNRGARVIDSRQGAVMVESVQEHGSRDGDAQGNPNISSQYLVDHSHKETEIHQQQYQIAYTSTRNPVSTSAVAYPNPNSHRVGNPTEVHRQQGTNIQQGHNQGNTLNAANTSNSDGNLQNVGRRTDSARINYQTNFPKISSNFDRPSNRNRMDKSDPPLGNTDNLPKNAQIPEPAPYTVIQTYADRLRFNQSKKGVSINLSDPEITTKQGLPTVLYVKDEI